MAISIAPQKIRPRTNTKAFFSLNEPGGFFLVTSILVLVAVMVGWLGLKGYTLALLKATQQDEEEYLQLESERSPKTEAELLTTVTRLRDIKNLLSTHRDGSLAFTFIESLLQPEVSLSDFTVEYESDRIVFVIEAPTFESLARQVVAFENDKHVKSVLLGSAGHAQGTDITQARVTGSVTIFVDGSTFEVETPQ